MSNDKKAVVVLSGGQDSVTCLGLALKIFGTGNVFAIGFNYGQKHSIELKCAKEICDQYLVPFKMIDMPFFGDLVTSALVSDEDVNQEHAYKEGLPASFVPNRNALFLTIAHAYAQEVGAVAIYTGVCQTDYSGYPDCRERFIQSLQNSLNIGYETDIEILTPLMHLTKAQTFKLAENVGFLETVITQTHTCYNGSRKKNKWGHGCGKCPACELRKKGFEEFLELGKE